jgi:hypothetical protein
MKEPCPYCATEDLITEVLGLPETGETPAPYVRIGNYLRETPQLGKPSTVFGKGSTRGEWWVIEYSDKALAERLKGFKVQLIGKAFEWPIVWPPGPFFQLTTEKNADGSGWLNGLYFAYRMTHKQAKGLAIDVHYWPTHGRRFEVRGISDEGLTPAEMRVVNNGLKLLRKESRGVKPPFDKIDVIKAIQKHGQDATQRAVAKALHVTPRSLQRWTERQGLSSWTEVRDRYLQTEVW